MIRNTNQGHYGHRRSHSRRDPASSTATPCHFFLRGICRFGEHCRNIHTRESASAAESERESPIGAVWVFTKEIERILWRANLQPGCLLSRLDSDLLHFIIEELRPEPAMLHFVNCTLQPLTLRSVDQPGVLPSAHLLPAEGAVVQAFVGQRWEAAAERRKPIVSLTVNANTTTAPELVFLAPPRSLVVLLTSDSSREAISTLHSQQEHREVSIRFVNCSSKMVRTCWVDWHGNLIEYSQLAPGEIEDQPTFVGHWWVILTADASHTLGYMVPVAGPGANYERRLVVPIMDAPTTPLDRRLQDSMHSVYDAF